MNRRSFIAGAACLAASASVPNSPMAADAYTTHRDGKVFVRINDHWMPL